MPKFFVVLCGSSSSLLVLPTMVITLLNASMEVLPLKQALTWRLTCVSLVLDIVIDAGYRCICQSCAFGCFELTVFCGTSFRLHSIAGYCISYITDQLVHLICDWQDCWLMTGYCCYILWPSDWTTTITCLQEWPQWQWWYWSYWSYWHHFYAYGCPCHWMTISVGITVGILGRRRFCWTICEHQIIWLWCWQA